MTFLCSLLLLSAIRATTRTPLNPKFCAGRSSNAESLLSFSIVGSVVGQLRLNFLIPVLRVTISLCLTMLAIQMAEKLFVRNVSLYAKLFRRKPEKVYKWKPIADKETSVFPMVLVKEVSVKEDVKAGSVSQPVQLCGPAGQLDISLNPCGPIIPDLKKWL